MTNKFSKVAFLTLVLGLLIPTVASAQAQTFSSFVLTFVDLIETAIPVLAGMALLAFLWGLTKFISSAGDEKKLAEGKSIMIWGTIAIFVMASLWGIIRFAYGEFGFSNAFTLPPYLPTYTNTK